MRYLSLFSGIEAASVAWKNLPGWVPVAFSEIEEFPSAVLAHRYPTVPNLGDMTKVDWAAYHGKVDLVVGGSPCQAFSIAGLRNSLDDDRGNLTLAYARAIHAIRPSWFLWENVPGVLNTKDNAFGCFLASLAGNDAPITSGLKGGKWDNAGLIVGKEYSMAYRILDAQFFGVPQRRRRVFLVGHLGDWKGPAQVLFEPQGVSGNPTKSRKKRKGTPSPAPESPEVGDQPVVQRFQSFGEYKEDDKTGTMKARHTNDNSDLVAFSTHSDGSATEDSKTHTLDSRAKDGPRRNQGGTIILTENPLTQEEIDDEIDHMGFNVAFTQGVLWADLPFEQQLNIQSKAEAYLTKEREAVCFQQNCRDEVRLIGGDGKTAGALISEPGMHGQNFVAIEEPLAFSSKDDGGDAGSVSPTIRAGGHDGSHPNAGVPPAVVFSIMPQNSGKDYKAREVEVTQPLMAGGPVGGNQGGDFVVHTEPIPFDTTQITHPDNGSNPQPGDHCPTLAKGGHPPAVIFQASELRRTGKITLQEVVPTLAADTEKGDNEAIVLTEKPMAFYPNNRQPDRGNYEDQSPALKASPNSHPGVIIPVGIDGEDKVGHTLRANPSHSGDKGDGGMNTSVVVESYDMRGNGDGEKVPTLTGHHAGAISDFSPLVVKDLPDVVGTLNSAHRGIPSTDEVAGGQVLPVIFDPLNSAATKECSTLGVNCGNSTGRSIAFPGGMQVRRLTPVECEKLQGFPPGYTLIPNYTHKVKDAEAEEVASYLGIPYKKGDVLRVTPDGPRYKALGNSMATCCMRFIGERIQAVEDQNEHPKS